MLLLQMFRAILAMTCTSVTGRNSTRQYVVKKHKLEHIKPSSADNFTQRLEIVQFSVIEKLHDVAKCYDKSTGFDNALAKLPSSSTLFSTHVSFHL